MWQYRQSTGELLRDGQHVATGYSGYQLGKNNPAAQAERDVGPIPQGRWTIHGPPFDTAEHGPYVLRLVPCDGTVTFDRDGFLIHGDSLAHPGEASRGCIILPHSIRQQLWESGDHELEVAA